MRLHCEAAHFQDGEKTSRVCRESGHVSVCGTRALGCWSSGEVPVSSPGQQMTSSACYALSPGVCQTCVRVLPTPLCRLPLHHSGDRERF
ncbi:hypothetical protein AAFF_G00161930 [Aldrovandia affinis]|uniref:Uncharacterized protein n=1 Tax=Aldrovandia affinis TaxID=143900 RepID=A0AAD7RMI5_9TELE|nr:hypothetical protein AAFF_G00161930 [Aldrovandia affinis]